MLIFTLLSYLLFILGIFLFSFSLWRKLKEDYTNEQIFSYSLGIAIFALLGLWIASAWLPQFTFFIVFGFIILSSLFFQKQLEIRFFELVDAFAPSFFVFSIFFGVGNLLENFLPLSSITQEVQESTISIVSILISFTIFRYFLKNYRKFSKIYPSGKIGFAGLGSLAIFFILKAFALVYSHFIEPHWVLNLPFLSLSQEVLNAIISLVLGLILVFVIYLRSGRRK